MNRLPRAGEHRGLPSREQILDFVKSAEGKVGKREIARAFGITGPDRPALKELLRGMADDGLIARAGRGRMIPPESLPPVAVAEVTGIDRDGDPVARPVAWRGEGEQPTITVVPALRRGPRPPGLGDRVLLRLSRLDDRRYEGRVIRVLATRPGRLVGVYRHRHDGPDGGRFQAADRRVRSEFLVTDAGGAHANDVVVAETLPARRIGLQQARIVEVLNNLDSPRAIDLLVLNAHGIPTEFSPAATALADRAEPPSLGRRTDLRHLPLVTIDEDDARDFDDAVWAAPDPSNPGGWHLVVAVADVAHYVRPGDAIDVEARNRGNSVYLPDMAVPMLPEALSNDLCSLRPGKERACLAAHMWIDSEGALVRCRFERALIKSAARLTYRNAQAAMDGNQPGSLTDTVIAPLAEAFACLRRGREARGPLDLDLPERRVLFDDSGQLAGFERRPRYDSHRVIEEFMITANVAAAQTLVARRAPCMFRVHDQPPLAKLEGLRDDLASLGYKLSRARRLAPNQLNRILAGASGRPEAETVALLVLRAQSQAEYSPHNIGHFGLNLPRYAHFTSPIRRYADLLVHRSLIRTLGLGDDGSPDGAEVEFEELGNRISATERRASTAERDALDRFAARFLADRVGASFNAAIVGVTRFGLFVRLAETGAEGLIPIGSFGEHMRCDERRHRLVGAESGRTHALGQTMSVSLAQADAVTGMLRFEPGATKRPVGSGPSRRPASKRHRRGRR